MDSGHPDLSSRHPVTPGGRQSEADLLHRAQTGDNEAFAELVSVWRAELHMHCYRMLGSLDDADDAVQETLIRSWRAIGSFQPDAPLRAWLYRIATNVCLTLLAKRKRQAPVASLSTDNDDGKDDAMRLDPYPDLWLSDLPRHLAGPETTIDREESVRLAFVAAVQTLPARQRAVLLMRDVLGFPAAEVAQTLSLTVAGANSLLQRARSNLNRERMAGRISREHGEVSSGSERKIIDRFVEAWQATDIPGIVSLLSDDALLTMPPEPLRVVGRDAVGGFLATVPAGGRLGQFRLVPMRANRQPALALYLRDEACSPFLAHAIMVLSIDASGITSLTRFADPALFARFDLPAILDPV